jgi:hypothetical protein
VLGAARGLVVALVSHFWFLDGNAGLSLFHNVLCPSIQYSTSCDGKNMHISEAMWKSTRYIQYGRLQYDLDSKLC